MRPCGDALVDLGVGGGSVKEEAVCTKDAFEDGGMYEGGKMRKVWGEGLCRCNGGRGGGVCGEDRIFLVGASVFVAPVECWGDREGFAGWEVDRLDTAFARWASDFHDKGEGG